MLRVTTQESPAEIRLDLEGDLIGIWVGEFFSAWQGARHSLNGRRLRIDLSAVGRVDKAGEYLLALVHCNGAQLIGSGLVMRDLINTIARDWPVDTNGVPIREEA